MGKEPGVVSLDTLGGKGTDEILTQLIKYANSFFYSFFFFFVTVSLKSKLHLNVDECR